MSASKRKMTNATENESNPKKKRKVIDANNDIEKDKKTKKKAPKWICSKIWNYAEKGGAFGMNELSEALTFFNENGFAVIKDVMDEKENGEGKKLLLDDIKEINKKKEDVNLDELQLDNVTNKLLPGWSSNGIRLQFGISHGRFAQFARLRPNIRKMFAHFHECNEEDLCCSWDSIAVTASNGKHKKELWLHADQSIWNEKNEKIKGWDFRSIQGALYFTETNEETVSFIASPKSHSKYWKKLAEKTKTKTKHWILLNEIGNDDDEECNKIKQDIMSSSYRIHVPKNGFLLWNSKVFHQNGDALKPNKNRKEIKRIASFICMAPKKYRDQKAFTNSIIFAINGTTTTHWPQFMQLHSSKHPRFSKNNCYEHMVDIKPKLNPEITEEQFKEMIPESLKDKQVKVYGSKESESLTLATVHHLGVRDLNRFKIKDLWKLMNPELKVLQPWMELEPN